MSDLSKLIGERLRIARKEKGLSQEELGSYSDLHPTYIGQLERGEKNITLETLDKILSSLGIELNEFFSFSFLDEDLVIYQIVNRLKKLSNNDLQLILKMLGNH
ncbi:helix-turn-helix domain-containing protein [Dehalobacter restrictus]|uniref:XRE family transcriptional regulator n=1 Tax=Dehalobacter restrictus (strain DSM 9455 / PER-K23) TaxID=871738 RepID=A0ABN4BP54_DEHRP|nr:helix-turn-helix transcriptional regulator [Dehalobacter restrictus]AHF09276.1 XRE family transcriptional regulator [Dehalobacter restrictus DSM 9455]